MNYIAPATPIPMPAVTANASLCFMFTVRLLLLYVCKDSPIDEKISVVSEQQITKQADPAAHGDRIDVTTRNRMLTRFTADDGESEETDDVFVTCLHADQCISSIRRQAVGKNGG
jgi:hypothetical protein